MLQHPPGQFKVFAPGEYEVDEDTASHSYLQNFISHAEGKGPTKDTPESVGPKIEVMKPIGFDSAPPAPAPESKTKAADSK